MRNSPPESEAELVPAPCTPEPAHAAVPPAEPAAEKREHLRFDKVFPVRVESILFGEIGCIARNVSAGGIFLETRDPLPLGSRVRVCFLTPDESAEIVALGEVKNHYFLNFNQAGVAKAVSGMAVRFLGFEAEGQHVLNDCLDRFRILH
jgi:PilZ domain